MSRRAFATAAATAAVAITTPPPAAVLAPAIAVSNVRGPAAPGPVAAHRRGPPAVAPFRKLEAERARDRVRLGEAQRQPLPDLVREIGRDIAVDGLALGLHRAAFEHRDLLPDLLELLLVVRRKPASTKPVGLHQRTMDEEIGIAPDRRSEVRVGREREPEMPEPLRPIA